MTSQYKPPHVHVLEPPYRVAVDDRRWFAKNPGRLYRARLTGRDELRLIRKAIGYRPSANARLVTIVRQSGDGAIMIYEHGPIDENSRNPAELDDVQSEAFLRLLHRMGCGVSMSNSSTDLATNNAVFVPSVVEETIACRPTYAQTDISFNRRADRSL